MSSLFDHNGHLNGGDGMPNNVNLQSSRPMKLNQVGPVCEEKSLEHGMKYGIVISLKKQLVIAKMPLNTT